jgi:hypothetical protein
MDDRLREVKRAFDAGDLEAGFLYYRLLRRVGKVEVVEVDAVRNLVRDDQYFSVVEDPREGFFMSGRSEKRIPTIKSIYLLPWLYHLLILEEEDCKIVGVLPRPDTHRFIIANASNAIKNIIRTYPDLASLSAIEDLTLEILRRTLPNATGVDNRISAMLTVLKLIKNQAILHQASLLPTTTPFMRQEIFRSLYNYHGILELIQNQLDTKIEGPHTENALLTLAKAAEHLDIDFDADYWAEVTLELLETTQPSQFDGGSYEAKVIHTLQQLMVYRNISESLEEEIIDVILRFVDRADPTGPVNVSRYDFQAANKLLAAIGYTEVLPHLQHILAGLTHPDDLAPSSSYASAMGRGATIRAYNLLEQAITMLESSL